MLRYWAVTLTGENSMIINIVGGSGIMGSVHKPIFEKSGHRVITSGRNSNPSIKEAAKQSDITIISVPIDATEEIIKEIGPYCKAIVDFTSLKEFPVAAMLKYSDKKCEVAGLHPLYGEVKSIKNKPIIYCKTERSGQMCQELINCLKDNGAEIIEMSTKDHDKEVLSLNQALRIKEVAAYIKTITGGSLSVEEMYKIAPPPTKAIIELCARQINENNDDMYVEMIKRDKYMKSTEDKFLDNFKQVGKNYKKIASELRNSFGLKFLREMQEKAEKNIEKN